MVTTDTVAQWTLREMAIASLMAVAIVLGGGALVAAFMPQDSSTFMPYLGPLFIAVLELLLFAPIAWVLGRHTLPWSVVGLRTPVAGWSVALALLFTGLFISYAVIIAWGLILIQFDMRPQPNIFPTVFGTGRLVFVMVYVAGAIVAPLAEEVFFRGFLFNGLRQFGLLVAYGVSAGVFALVHFTPTALPALFGLGIVLAWLYNRTESVWPPIFLHTFVNSLTLILWYLEATNALPTPAVT